VLQTFANSLLSLLLAATLFCGGCISCEQYFMVSGAKRCCLPNGHCKTTSPAGQKTSAECQRIACDHQKPIDSSMDRPAAQFVPFDPPPDPVNTHESWLDMPKIEQSPPDLQVLHSTFLI